MSQDRSQSDMDQINELGDQLNQLSNLIAALQIVCFDVCGMKADDPIGAQRRDAIVGLGDALERALPFDTPWRNVPGEVLPTPQGQTVKAVA